MTKTAYARNLIRCVIFCLLPLAALLLLPLPLNLLDMESRSIVTQTNSFGIYALSYLAQLAATLKAAVYGGLVCYILFAKQWNNRALECASCMVPLACLLLITLFYFRIPLLYRRIGGLKFPVLLMIPFAVRLLNRPHAPRSRR